MAPDSDNPLGGDLDDSILSQGALDALIAAAETSGADSAQIDWSTDPDPQLASPSAGPMDFATFAGTSVRASDESMSRIKDIPLEITVELGRTRLLIRDILDLNSGSIIELEKIAGEPVDLLANGLLVARGEVIVIDDNFGVRVTEIITSGEREDVKAVTDVAA